MKFWGKKKSKTPLLCSLLRDTNLKVIKKCVGIKKWQIHKWLPLEGKAISKKHPKDFENYLPMHCFLSWVKNRKGFVILFSYLLYTANIL